MSTSVMFHDVKTVCAKDYGDIGVLSIDGTHGRYVSIFMPYAKAKAMADAFNATQIDATPPASFATSA